MLRFDVRGMGDSSGTPPGFERIEDDIAAAIDALLAAVPETSGVVLWGLCDGASAALLYLDTTHDTRVVGLGIANPWVRSEVGLARTRVRFRSYVGDASKLDSGAGAALDRVEAEDEAIVEAVQRGVRSRLYRGGRYSPARERGVHQFHRLISEFLA